MAKKKPAVVNKAVAYDEAKVRKAAAIVGQVLAHFGAGYAVAWEKSRKPGQFPQIFEKPKELATFHHKLLESVLKFLPSLRWDTDGPARDGVCLAAFQHGVLAFHTKPSRPLTYEVIESTLRVIHDHVCPPGKGGGKVCRF